MSDLPPQIKAAVDATREWCDKKHLEVVADRDRLLAEVEQLKKRIRVFSESIVLHANYSAHLLETNKKLDADLAKSVKQIEAGRDAAHACEVLNDLPIEHDENGHAFKRIACRSVSDHGAELATVVARLRNAELIKDTDNATEK